MKSPVVLFFFFFLSSTPANLFAGGWVLTTPDFTITETEVIPTKKWVALESFATASQCNDRRSSMITDIDKERRELRNVEDHTAAIESEENSDCCGTSTPTPSASQHNRMTAELN
jgi:hypothetical protein